MISKEGSSSRTARKDRRVSIILQLGMLASLAYVIPWVPLSVSHDSSLCAALYIMITNKVYGHGQFVWLFTTETRVQMIRLWRPVLLVGFMRNQLNASGGYGCRPCRRGAIFLEGNSTTCRGDFLWAAMTLNKYSEHRTEAEANTGFLHIRGKEVGQRAIHPCGTNWHCNYPGYLEHLLYCGDGW